MAILAGLLVLLAGCSTTNVIIGTPASVTVERGVVEIKTLEPKTKITVRDKNNPYGSNEK